jgi:hypothetical protein
MVLQQANKSSTIGMQCCYKEVAAALRVMVGGAVGHGRRSYRQRRVLLQAAVIGATDGGCRCYDPQMALPHGARGGAARRGGSGAGEFAPRTFSSKGAAGHWSFYHFYVYLNK